MTDLAPPAFRVGDFVVQQVVEFQAPFRPLATMFPEAARDPAALEALLPRLQPWCVDEQGRAILPVQSYVIRTGRHVILIDTCVGCDKTNSRFPEWAGRQDEGWLQRLQAMGMQPEQVTHVLCTHLHSDHSGWNTRLLDGRWVPTFPNARYIFAKAEVAHAEANETELYAENVLPVIAAGQADLVETDHQIEDGVWLEPTPGHTPGHVAVHLVSAGRHAVMWGDLLHSPAQALYPHWAYARDVSAADSTASRWRVLGAAAEHNRLILSSHFPLPSVGRVRSEGAGFWFDYEGETR
ncbi:MAG: MBL fold metallo-hydrolase [Pseudomonadota bacterium]